MPTCRKCRTYNVIDVRDCKKCGSLLLPEDGDACPCCQKEVGPFAKTCRSCGCMLPKTNAKSWSHTQKKSRKISRKKSSKMFWIVFVVVFVIGLYVLNR